MMPSAKKQHTTAPDTEQDDVEVFNLLFLIATALDNTAYWEDLGIDNTNPKNPSFITKMQVVFRGAPSPPSQKLFALREIALSELSRIEKEVPPTQTFFSFFQTSASRLQKATILLCSMVAKKSTERLLQFIDIQSGTFPPQRREAPSLPESSPD